MEQIEDQRAFWNAWNRVREQEIGEVSVDQIRLIERWLGTKRNLDMLDVGCGAGWCCERLLKYGRVTGTDLADEVLQRARQRCAEARFVAGDFMGLKFADKFDVIVCLEVLSHVADHRAFIDKLGSHLRLGGELMLATQNRYVLEKNKRIISPVGKGQLRQWFTQREVRELLRSRFEIIEMTTRTPKGNEGILRLINGRLSTRVQNRLFLREAVKQVMGTLGLGWSIVVRGRVKS